jgi:hypothetical protein
VKVLLSMAVSATAIAALGCLTGISRVARFGATELSLSEALNVFGGAKNCYNTTKNTSKTPNGQKTLFGCTMMGCTKKACYKSLGGSGTQKTKVFQCTYKNGASMPMNCGNYKGTTGC